MMVFDVNQAAFKSEAQREAWRAGIQLVPPAVSLAEVEDEGTREGCMQVYACTGAILEGLYESAEEDVPTLPRFSRALEWFRFSPGSGTDADGLGWTLQGEVIKTTLEKNLRVIEAMRAYGFALTGGERLREENKKGRLIIGEGDALTLRNARYPLMLSHWQRLRGLAEKRKVNVMDYVNFCDFRVFAKAYRRTLEDLLRPLPDAYKAHFRTLHDYALAKGAKLESHKYYGRFRYVYGGLYLLVLENNPPQAAIPYRLDNARHIPGELERFVKEAEIKQDADALIAYIQRNICICNRCALLTGGQKPLEKSCGKWVEIHGARRFAAQCGSSISRAHHGPRQRGYTDADFPMLKRMMDLRIAQIEGFKA